MKFHTPSILLSALSISRRSIYGVNAECEPFEYPTCGDCWCSPSYDCPEWEPETYSCDTIAELKAQVPDNIYTIDCNPYAEGDCVTDPVQEYVELGDEAVCGLKYYSDVEGKSCTNYVMESYESWEKAEADGAFVTHIRSCGVCSTTEDLAAYMGNPTLEEESIKCTVRGLIDFDDGIACYRDSGLTEECAKMWLYDGYHTTKECTKICLAELKKDDGDVPANGPPPECELSKCLECDEELSGPIFVDYAGRIRRTSGLLSSIVRPCEGFVQITHEPCPINAVTMERAFIQREGNVISSSR